MRAITSFQYPDGTHSPLSNFYPASMLVNGIRYPTLEHAFQAAKTNDPEDRRAIAEIPLPGMAKRAGRCLELRADWETVKLQIMLDLLRLKFTRETAGLSVFLLATGDALLVEGNVWGDRFWGRCTSGVGQNWLGVLLMAVRAELRAAECF
jgi:ribA/ribD-fused uncharacterized protein